MKQLSLVPAVALLLLASGCATTPPQETPMTTPAVSLGYVILYVEDVAAALAFYEKAFGLTQRFFNDDNGKAYGELETGATIVRRAMARLGPGYPRRRPLRIIRLLLVQALRFKSSETLFDPEDTEFYDSYDTEAGGYEKAGIRYLNSPRS